MKIYFGESLKRLRIQNNLTQEALAGFIGVSFQTISKWENGKAYPDIAILPQIALFFNVSVDELLGINKLENEQKINEYLSMYEEMYFKRRAELFEHFESAVKEFPNDYRILVRYMELLFKEKDNPYIKEADVKAENSNNPYKNGFRKNPDYDKISQELLSIYNNIQKHCTEDNIRIWSKHIIINHLMKKYDLSYDEKTEKWSCDKDSLNMAESILKTMPALCDARECLELRVSQDISEFTEICKNNIEELSYLLQDIISSYCYYPYYDNQFSTEYRISAIKHINGIFKMVDNDNYISKNRINLIFNYGHLGHLYAELGDNDNAFKYLRLCAEYAVDFDADSQNTERILRFYEFGTGFRNISMSQRMRLLMTEHYPLTEEFRETDEFKDIITLLG